MTATGYRPSLLKSSPAIPSRIVASTRQIAGRLNILPMRNNFRNQSSHLPERPRSRPGPASFGSHGLGRSQRGKRVQTAGPNGVHVYAARRDHGSVLAQRSRDVSVLTSTGPGITAAGARPVSADEGHLRRIQRSLSTAHRTHSNSRRGSPRHYPIRISGTRSASPSPPTRLPRIRWARLLHCLHWNWPRCRRRTRKTRRD